MKSAFAQFDGGIPDNYDEHLGPNIFVDYAADLAHRVEKLKPQKVLELAAGTGIVTRLLRDTLDDQCDLTATDLNDPMIDVARKKFRDDERITLQHADALALPFQDEFFDVIVCQFGVMFFPDKDVSYRQALRVLRPAGHYVFNVWGSFEANPFARVANETVTAFYKDDPPGFYQVPFCYHDAEQITKSLQGAGFTDVKTEVSRIEKPVVDYEGFAQGLVYGNPLVDEIRRRGDVDPEIVKTTMAENFLKEFGDVPSTMPLQAMFVSGQRPATAG